MANTKHTTALARLNNLERRFARLAVEHRKIGERDQALAADKVACVARYCRADLLASVKAYQKAKPMPRKVSWAVQRMDAGPSVRRTVA